MLPRISVLRLYLAAHCMELPTRADRFLQHFQHGNDSIETLQAIRKSTLTELRKQRLGVTEQFWKIHQLHDEPKMESCVEHRRDKLIGQSFVSVQNEPYYWVVQSELQADGAWHAIWSYCSHRANVYLSMIEDE